MDAVIITIQATHNQYVIQKVISKFYIKNKHSQTSTVKEVYVYTGFNKQ